MPRQLMGLWGRAEDSPGAYLQATTLIYAGLASRDDGHPNDALKSSRRPRYAAGRGSARSDQASSSIVLATAHVRAGERDGLPLAHGTIGSRRLRGKLAPLAAALATQPGRDAHELARMVA